LRQQTAGVNLKAAAIRSLVGNAANSCNTRTLFSLFKVACVDNRRREMRWSFLY